MVSTSSPPACGIDYLLLLDTAPPDDASFLRLNSALLLSPSRRPHPRYNTALEQETIHASSRHCHLLRIHRNGIPDLHPIGICLDELDVARHPPRMWGGLLIKDAMPI